MSPAHVITYDSRFLPAFISLNEEWIQRHFAIEEMDRRQLRDPHGFILKGGGEIFFVIEKGVAVGTCAMIPHGESGFELAKMAVAPDTRGKGYGDLLMVTAIDWARAKGASEIQILSNTVLEPAIQLYKKHGFQTVHLGPHPDYQRCNIEMVLKLRRPL